MRAIDNQKFYNVVFYVLAIVLLVVSFFTGTQTIQGMTLLFAWRTMMYASDLWDRLKDK